MASADDHALSIVARLRGWGFDVEVLPNAVGRNNGIDWSQGVPVAMLEHHFVCGLNPDPSYGRGMVDMLDQGYDSTPGPVVNWFASVVGKLYLISTGPANHSGRGNSSVLNRVMNDQAPAGPAALVAPGNDMNGNSYLDGIETQHPGDSTPWPQPLLDAIAARSAAYCIEYGYTANRAFHHYEWTDRKDDMSFLGGPSSNDGGNWLRSAVGSFIAAHTGSAPIAPPTPPAPAPPPPPEDDMPYSEAQLTTLMEAAAETAVKKVLFDHNALDIHWGGQPSNKQSFATALANTALKTDTNWQRESGIYQMLTTMQVRIAGLFAKAGGKLK